MSREEDIKQEIKEAIQQFATGIFADNALALFKELGYESNKRIALDKGAFKVYLQNTKPPMRKRHSLMNGYPPTMSSN